MAVILAGLGSVAFHASLREWGGWADLLGAAAILVFPIVYRTTRASGGLLLARYTVLLGGLAGLLWVLGTGNGKYVLAALGLLAVIAEGVTMSRSVAGVDREWRWLAGVASLLALGGGVWWLSRTDGVLCSPDAVWQWHGVWHAAAATALLMLFLYWRSETRTGPLRGQGVGAGREGD